MSLNAKEFLLGKENPDVMKLGYIEISLLVMALAAVVLFVTGSSRRRGWCGAIAFVQWLSYILVSNELFTFTIGQMQGATFQNELLPLWGAFMLIVFGQVHSFSAYSPEDNEQWKKYSWIISLQSFFVAGMVSLYSETTKQRYWVIPILGCMGIEAEEKIAALKMAARSSLAENTKPISAFMSSEHRISIVGEPDPIQMNGYNYLVTGDRVEMFEVMRPQYQMQLNVARDEVVTLQKLWQCQGRLLTGETGQQLKDICFSFALFKLLLRRFGGQPFSESSLDKTWQLVRNGLLEKEGDYERALRVIEVELSFLFDLFYTKYAVIFKGGQGFRGRKILSTLFLVGFGVFIAREFLINYKPKTHELNLITTHGVNVDTRVTGIIIVGILFMAIAECLCLIVSNWAMVLFICNYVRGIYDCNYLMLLLTKMVLLRHRCFKPWGRKLGQYSLLKSFHRDPLKYEFRSFLSEFWPSLSDLVDVRQGRAGNTKIELPEEVKKAVILNLRTINDRNLSNGEKSLRQNDVRDELLWACSLETPTHVILVWHIATSLCKIATTPNSLRNGNFVVATRLSDYCAYLVAFAPRLISDNATDSEFIFDEVLKDCRGSLKECKSDRDKYEKIMSMLGGQETIIHEGARLANDLQRLQNESDFMWKVLADFWAELMLFVAPSGDPRAHVEHLAEGGEFVTHLWALLSHAGVLNNG
ncbi:hypothetical protein SLA2020_242570 [Shorea laevis]